MRPAREELANGHKTAQLSNLITSRFLKSWSLSSSSMSPEFTLQEIPQKTGGTYQSPSSLVGPDLQVLSVPLIFTPPNLLRLLEALFNLAHVEFQAHYVVPPELCDALMALGCLEIRSYIILEAQRT